uniref:Heat shock transcription factor 1 n=1 Tax=Equus caballus TaxID=9796 RepID=A0A9L0TQ92_HORSE
MDLPVGPGAAGPSNVPAFLTKLWTLVSDPDTDALICWSPSGNSFHVFDQGQFAKEVLPKYFKHNNMASFVRQLNMYGFRKVVHIEQGGLVKPERDDTEFQHPCFLRGQEQLLENIKRKVTSVSTLKNDDIKIRQDSVTKLLTDVQLMKGKQESMDSKLLAMKHENEALWREVASLRQKHAQQQKVVNKLIQFLISLVQSNRILGVKRKIPLMLNDSSSAHSMPKYGRQYSLEHIHGSGPYSAPSPAYSGSSLYSPDAVASSGPIISDITELAPSSPLASPGGSIDERWGLHHPSSRVGRRVGPAEAPANVCPLCADPCPSAPWCESRRSPQALPGAPGWRRPVPGNRPLLWRPPCPQPPSSTLSCGRASLPLPPRPRPSQKWEPAPPRPHLPRPPRSASALPVWTSECLPPQPLEAQPGLWLGLSWRAGHGVAFRPTGMGVAGGESADLALSSEFGAAKEDGHRPGCPTVLLPQKPRVCGQAGLLHLLSVCPPYAGPCQSAPSTHIRHHGCCCHPLLRQAAGSVCLSCCPAEALP